MINLMPDSILFNKPLARKGIGCRIRVVNIFIVVLSIVVVSAFAPNQLIRAQTVKGGSSELNIERLETIISALETDDKAGDAQSQARLIDIYKTALEQLRAAAKEKESAAQFKNIAETGAEQLAEIQMQIDAVRLDDDADVFANVLSTQELESQLTAEQSALLELRNQLSGLKDELSELGNRPRAARQEAIDARKMLEELHRSTTGVVSDRQDRIEEAKRGPVVGT